MRTLRVRIVLGKGFAVMALVFAVCLSVGTGQAFAARPWWHLITISSPPREARGEAQVIVDATNLGDGVANELNSPITVRDVLPSGVRSTKVYGQGDGTSFGEGNLQEAAAECELEPEPGVVSCRFPKRVGPYEKVMLVIDVTVKAGAGTGVSEASVSGGFAAPVLSRQALALEGEPPFGVRSLELMPEEEGGAPYTQAGGHPFQLTSTLILNTQVETKHLLGGNQNNRETLPLGLTKDLRFHLPPGLVGNPTPIPKCNVYVFSQQAKGVAGFECPNDTVVGVATTMVGATGGVKHAPLEFPSPIYSLEPAVGEPARFGFLTPVAVPVILDTAVQTGGGYGVIVSVSNITQAAAFIGSQVTFWGNPSDHRHNSQRGTSCLDKIANPALPNGGEVFCSLGEQGQPFLVMPTVCEGAPRTTVEADSWEERGVWRTGEYSFQTLAGEPLSFDGCNQLSFEPSLKVTPDGQQASTPTGLHADVHVSQDASLNPTGDADSAVRSITVTLPEGVSVDPSGAGGLQACPLLTGKTAGQEELEEKGAISGIDLETAQPANCPDASKVATVTIHTPLLPNPLKGAVYLASQEANPFGSLIALYLVAKDPISGVLVKLAGRVSIGETGQLTTTFENPPLPFEDAELEFFGGSRAPLTSPPTCGSYTTSASIAPWSGNPASQIEAAPFQILTGPDKTPGSCQSPLAFKPELATGSLNLQAGAFTPFTTTMTREDGNQNLSALQLKMPPGLSGLLTGVELCPEPQADEGTCGPNSLIGETTVSVGLGSDPYTVTGGKVYLTGPYKGAPFGLSIVNPAKAGPFDLENTRSRKPACDCLVVRAKIEVDPVTADLTVTSDTTGPYTIPTQLEGIPLEIKHVNVTIDRSGFTFNPTNCEPMSVTGSLSSTQGATQALHIPFQVTNCATLGFKPGFKVSTSGKTSRADGASLHASLAYPRAPFGSQANIRSVKVDLPKELPSRLTTLQKACTQRQFATNPAGCPAASRVGQARAVTPLIPVPLEGPAYFVSHGGAKFPELIVVLQGYGVTIDLHGETFIDEKTGITSSTFHTVPDAPVGSFELTLPQGPDSALAANTNLCAITKTILVKRKITLRAKNGHTRTVTRKAKQTVPGALAMPTLFTAQNGATIKQSTPIEVTGCGKARKAKRANAVRHRGSSS